MAENRVELIVDARAAAADADIDRLKMKLNDLGRQVETAKVKLDGDKDAELRLARLDASLLALGRKVSNPKIKLDGVARAEADILAVDLSLDRLNDKGPGMLSRLGASFVQLGTEAGGLASTIGLILVPIAALVAIISGPLLASLLPIAAGFAAFGAGAIGEIKKVITAHQQLQAAQQAYEKATTSSGRASALRAEKLATEDLTGSEKGLLGMLNQLGAMFHQLQKAVQPQVVQAFGTALTILKQVMPTLIPLAVAAGKAINTFLNSIHNWLNSNAGQRFLVWMQTDGPKAIAKFGQVLWDVAQGIGRTFAFLDHAGTAWWTNVTNGTRTISKAATQAGSAIAHAFDNTVHAANNVIHAFGNLVHAGENVVHAGSNVVNAFQNVWHAGGNVVHAIENVISAVQSAVGWFGRLASAANSALGGIPGKVLGALGFEHGGIVGAASGGARGGMTWVGERGPELVRLPRGSMVYPAGQSAAMAAQGGSGGGNNYSINVTVAPGGHPGETGRQIVQMIREFEKRSGASWRAA